MEKPGLLRSSLLMVAARILSAVGSFALFWLISQENVAQLGAFRTVFVFFLVCDFLPLLGMNQYIIREISLRRKQGRAIFSSGFLFTCLTCLFIIPVLVAIALFGKYSPQVSSGILIVAASVPATAVALCCQSVLVGTGDGASFGLLQGGEIILRTMIGGTLFLLSPDIITIFYCFALIRWLSLIPYLKKIILLLPEGSWKFRAPFIREFFTHVPSFAGILLFFLVLRFAPQLMVPWMVGDKGAGYFALIYQFLDLLLLVPTALTINLMPVLAVQAGKSTKDLAKTSLQSLKLVTILLLPAVLFIGIKAEPILVCIFGPQYSPVAPLLSITIGSGLIMAWDQVFSTAMVAAKQQKLDLLTLAVAGSGMMILLYILILRYGILGAALAFISGMTLLIICRISFFIHIISPLNLLTHLWRYCAAGCIMAIGLFFFRGNLFFSIILAGILYLGSLFLQGSLTKKELLSLLVLLRKNEDECVDMA